MLGGETPWWRGARIPATLLSGKTRERCVTKHGPNLKPGVYASHCDSARMYSVLIVSPDLHCYVACVLQGFDCSREQMVDSS